MPARNFLCVFSAALVFAGLFSPAAEAGARRMILQGADLGAVARELARDGGVVEHRMEFIQALVAQVPEPALKGLARKFPGLQISEDLELSANGRPGTISPQPAQSIPWGVSRIRATDANAYNRGAGVKVCVVDTGVDITHPDLSANIAGGRNFVWSKGKLLSANFNDDNGHGTHVAGTIAAVDNGIGVIGVAPAAKIYAVKVLNSKGSGYLSDITDGIYDCMASGARVINMSLGGQGDPNAASPMRDAVNAARAAGVIVVVAAGNEGQNIMNTVPAGFSGVIAVSALDSDLAFPSWSNFGLGEKDLAAPGVNIPSTWKGGAYNTISGTSMAAPHVAGVAALLLSSGSLGFVSDSVGAPVSQQGSGLVNALGTVRNLATP